MIDHSEIRIGNLVYMFGDAVSLTKEHMIYLLMEDKQPHPITLTEEWLTKFGYSYANENGQKFYWHIEMPYFQLRRDDEDCWLLWYDEDSMEALICKEEIKYVHQLQNLYYALTGTELEIK